MGFFQDANRPVIHEFRHIPMIAIKVYGVRKLDNDSIDIPMILGNGLVSRYQARMFIRVNG